MLGLLVLLGGCASALFPQPAPPPMRFTLADDTRPADVQAPSAPSPAASGPTLIVSVPRAAAGFDTSKIVYLRRPLEIEYFAYSQWVETPPNMLAPLMVRAIERTGAFHAVLRAPTSATGQLRLDTELIRIQQDFSARPSHVTLTLRAVLIDTATREVVASREFDANVQSPSDDPYGGVIAAQRATGQVLAELAAFCAALSAR